MTPVLYDGSFDGLLSAVFDVYEYRLKDVEIQMQTAGTPSLFGAFHEVTTDPVKAKRVWAGLEQKISIRSRVQLYKTFLSEIKGIENVLLRYMQYAFASKYTIESDYTNADVYKVQQVSRKVHKEKHRMEAFVRFQKLKDGLFYALVQPDFNVLPLISRHFEERYADQPWLIYDAARKYGLHYDLQAVHEVQLNFSDDAEKGIVTNIIYDESEALYQALWQQYFSSVNIAARKNTKLHIQHMPKRYWKHLVEKKG